MTNKFNNWERLVKVIERFGVSVNSFARCLGFARAESLYHIRRGNYGISEDLADRIVKLDGDIDRTWLLTGVGNMLRSEPLVGESLPFYREEMEDILTCLDLYEPTSHIFMPYATGSDFVVRTFSRPMSDTVTAANDLLLKKVAEINEVVQGNEYVMLIGERIIWRRVRYVNGDPMKLRLVARNREEFADLFVDLKDIKAAWRVIARISVLES
jgi:hypothetical protein